MDDPGKFLQGDYPGGTDGVDTPTSVMFADGETTKTVTSLATGAVLAAQDDCATDRPGAEWCTTMTVEAHTSDSTVYGFDRLNGRNVGSLDDRSFEIAGKTHTVDQLVISSSVTIVTSVQNASHLRRGWAFNFGGTEFTITASSEANLTRTLAHYRWPPTDFTWVDGQKVTVSLRVVETELSIADATATVSDHYIKFDVSLNHRLDEGVKFRYRITSGSAHDSGITAWNITPMGRFWIYIFPGELDQQIFVPLKWDVDAGDDVNVRIFDAKLSDSGTQVLINDATAIGTIAAAPTTSIVSGYKIAVTGTTGHESTTPSGHGKTALQFPVHLTPAARNLGEFVCYKYETIDSGANAGTATPGDEVAVNGRFTHIPNNADYRKTSGRGYIRSDVGSGAASWDSFSVIIFDDEVNDDNETVKVKLSEGHVCGDASRTIRFSSSTPTGTIHNSDPIPARSFAVHDAEATEGVDALLDFVVTLGKTQEETVTVDYATSDGTATAGSDYTAQSGTLTFSPGEATKIISIPIANDSVDDDRETVTLTLSNASSGAAIRDGEAVGKIDDTCARKSGTR